MCACSLTQNAARLVRALMEELPGAAVQAAADIVSCVSPVSLTDVAAAPANINQPQLESASGRSEVQITAGKAAAKGGPTAANVQRSRPATALAASAPQPVDEASVAADAAAAAPCGAVAPTRESGSTCGGSGRDSTAGGDGLATALPYAGSAGAAWHGECQVLMSHDSSECAVHR